MYVRTSEGLGQGSTSQGSLAETLRAPPIRSAPRLLGRPYSLHQQKFCVATPPPRLLGEKDNTLYVEISHGIDEAENKYGKKCKVKPCTGIFVPKGYSVGHEINLILYLHGHTSTYPGDGVSIDGYWDASKFPFFAFRERLNDSGKNVILVAPTLGPLSQAGPLLTRWPDAYLDQVMMALMAHGPYKKRTAGPISGNIILACHSGGGSPMRKIALSNNRYTANIQECWGFDCLNGGNSETKEWIAWAKSHPTKNLYIYYCDHVDKDPKKSCTSTKVNSQRLKRDSERPSNVIVEKATAKDHFWVPLAHWKERIKNTTFAKY